MVMSSDNLLHYTANLNTVNLTSCFDIFILGADIHLVTVFFSVTCDCIFSSLLKLLVLITTDFEANGLMLDDNKV